MKRFFLLLWKGWKKFALVLGAINTRILLTLTYFVPIALVSIVARTFGADFLDRRMKKKRPSLWHEREPVDDTLDGCRRQF